MHRSPDGSRGGPASRASATWPGARLRSPGDAGLACRRKWWVFSTTWPDGWLADASESSSVAGSSPAEGFPKVILDAMAVGLPVVASGVGPLTEVVESGIVGRFDGSMSANIA